MITYVSHRINTTKELETIDIKYGVEIDLRDKNDTIILAHDPYNDGELFDTFLSVYRHSFLILNIKSERIEFKIIDALKKYGVTNYFFLDSSFPMIHLLAKKGEKNIAIRYSEYECIETVLNMKNKINWVWVDCFSKQPLTSSTYSLLKSNGFKICIVSPELQGFPEKICIYKDFFERNNIVPDMICTKYYNIDKWKSNVQIIIPMSGIGQRFVQEGYTDPKPLIKIDNKPMIKHVVDLFPDETSLLFICNEQHINNTNMMTVLDEYFPHKTVKVVPNEGRKGPVHAVSLAFDDVDDDKEVIVSYCDYGTSWNYKKFLDDIRTNNSDGAIACYRRFHPHMLGTDNYAFVKESDKWLQQIQEKRPFTDNRMNEYASNGTYYFKSGKMLKKYFSLLMENNITVNNEFYVSMVYNLMVKDQLKVRIYEIDKMLQWGTPYDLEIYLGWSSYFHNVKQHQNIFTDKLNTTLILPMAGCGSRFSQKGYKDPKPLIKVNGTPMCIEAVKCLPETSNQVFICLDDHLTRYELEKNIKKYYGDSTIIGIKNVTDGQACTCKIGVDNSQINLDSPILISACDNGVYYDTNEYQKLIDDKKNDVIVWSFRNSQSSKINPNMYAWLDVDRDGYIKHVSCKKFIYKDPLKTHAIVGTMFFRKARYFVDGYNKNVSENIRTNGEFYVDDIINQNIKDGLAIKVFEVKNYICWGTPDDYETYCYWKDYFDLNIIGKQ